MRLLFYIIPAVMDIIVGLFFFVSAKRMAESGASSYMVAMTMSIWAICYAVTSFANSYVLRKRNAVKILLTSQVIVLLSLIGLAFTESVVFQLVWLVGTGAGGGLFFTSAQVVSRFFAKGGREEFESMIGNCALYTFSWSTGLALGPFIAAFVWGLFDTGNGWRYCYVIAIALMLLKIACVLKVASHVRMNHLDEEDEAPGGAQASSADGAAMSASSANRLPDLMMAGWLLQALGYIAVAMMRTYLPDYCTKVIGMSTFHQGVVMSLVSFAQAVTGLACYKARRWPYHPWTVGGISLVSAIAFVIFAGSSNWMLYALAAVLLGVFSGMFCFVAIFHALISPTKSAFYASVNETIVGLGSVAAPMLGGFLATNCGVLAPFRCCLVCLVACAVIYGAFTWKYRRV